MPKVLRLHLQVLEELSDVARVLAHEDGRHHLFQKDGKRSWCPIDPAEADLPPPLEPIVGDNHDGGRAPTGQCLQRVADRAIVRSNAMANP